MSSDTRRRDHAAVAVREVLAGDRKVGTVSRSARRRRLELRRLGRTLSAAAEDEAAKRVRPASDSSSDSSDSAKVAPEPTSAAKRCPSCVSHGAVSVIGRRREMEDAIYVAAPFLAAAKAAVERSGDTEEDEKEGEEEEGFFAVYDGHGGSRVAEACRERMHVVLAEEVRLRRLLHGGDDADVADEDRARWKEAMAACFARVDSEVGGAEESDAGEQTVGSTAVVAVVGPRRIVVANCGDSRAVLSRGGVAVPLSSDHKPDRPDEMERVEAAGGRVINWNGYRILGVLATSRSIGDYYLKPYVIAEPEVTVMDRTDKDEFLILASDGLWDVVSNEVACKIARNCLSGRAASRYPESVPGSTAADAAALLVELAISRGSKDNISVVVVELRRLKSRRTTASKENAR
ncbi:probable protein phosphatase 2C 8 [Oryza brachyantha]|uniref:probable protein phosphatase 2C 8 n=1 Tax=Oryza brachyantha TaxID=4533 RepID=UPI001ADC9F8B|nr:probable protein phosphatase 2C 8 [Oryza brachyantha]